MPAAFPSQPAPLVIPRWEWRAFGPLQDWRRRLKETGTHLENSEGHEVRLLCLTSSHDVSIRQDRLSLKWRKQIGQEGLELWDAVLESQFPCERDTVQRLFETWAIPSLCLPRPHYALPALLEEVIQTRPELRVVEVDQRSEAYSLEGARCEWTRLTANGTPLESLCIEHEDPNLALQVVQRLGLQARHNTSYPLGLKMALHLLPQH